MNESIDGYVDDNGWMDRWMDKGICVLIYVIIYEPLHTFIYGHTLVHPSLLKHQVKIYIEYTFLNLSHFNDYIMIDRPTPPRAVLTGVVLLMRNICVVLIISEKTTYSMPLTHIRLNFCPLLALIDAGWILAFLLQRVWKLMSPDFRLYMVGR